MPKRSLTAGVLIIGLLLLTAGSISVAQDETTVTLSALTLGAGETGVVEGVIVCSEPDGCAAFDITIRFDAAIVSVDRVETGPYLGGQIFEAENSVDNEAGIVRLAVTALAARPEFGEPVLLRLTVTGRTAGMAVLNVSELLVSDLAGNPVAAAGIGGVVVVESAPAATETPVGGGSGEIAYTSERDGNDAIYIMNADGSNPRRLTDGTSAAWSPDGSRLAFRLDTGTDTEIFVMDADGGNLRNLTNHPAHDGGPAWSPDGTQIAFFSGRDDANNEIYVMDADGSNVRRLTDHPALDLRPTWSPDGTQLAFQSRRDGNWEIYLMALDGGNLRNLTNHPAYDAYPAWSPDGTRIAFTSMREGSSDVYVINPDGSGLQRLTATPNDKEEPRWSPDGSQIVFTTLAADQDARWITVINPDGSSPHALTDEAQINWQPAWRPAPPDAP